MSKVHVFADSTQRLFPRLLDAFNLAIRAFRKW